MKRIFIFTFLAAILQLPAEKPMASDKTFETVKNKLAEARLAVFNVDVIVYSQIFETADTSSGVISIARDGRYCAHLNDDAYLYDGQCVWEISMENRQATKKCLKEGEAFENQFFFLKNLDDYYKTTSLEKGNRYLLTLKTKKSSELPDSLEALVDGNNGSISEISFRDLNGDLNKIKIRKSEYLERIDDDVFKVKLPDSLEIITMP
jgi:outer membrane lipoprotein-sorting protein